jgi:hypothetical protein
MPSRALRTLLALRISRWQFKALYVAGAYALGFILVRGLDALGVPELTTTIITAVVDVAAVLYGARIFRVSGEPRDAPRAWWRMTGRRTLSSVLGILFAFFGGLWLLAAVLLAFGIHPSWASTGQQFGLTLVFGLEWGVLGFLYLNSMARLPADPPKPPKVPSKYDVARSSRPDPEPVRER